MANPVPMTCFPFKFCSLKIYRFTVHSQPKVQNCNPPHLNTFQCQFRVTSSLIGRLCPSFNALQWEEMTFWQLPRQSLTESCITQEIIFHVLIFSEKKLPHLSYPILFHCGDRIERVRNKDRLEWGMRTETFSKVLNAVSRKIIFTLATFQD